MKRLTGMLEAGAQLTKQDTSMLESSKKIIADWDAKLHALKEEVKRKRIAE